jgi:hypothetical protein
MRTFALDRNGDPKAQVSELIRTLDSPTGLPVPSADEYAADVAAGLGVSVDGAKNLIKVAVNERWAAWAKGRRRELAGSPDEPHPDDVPYSKLGDDPARHDRVIRAIAVAQQKTYLEAYEHLIELAQRYRDDYAARMLDKDNDPPLSKVLAKGALTLATLDAATGVMHSKVRQLAKADDTAPVNPPPVEPVPFNDDAKRLEILAHVGPVSLAWPSGEPEGPALVEARRAYVLATDDGLKVGEFKDFVTNWLQGIRDREDFVATLTAKAKREAMVQSYNGWVVKHDQRVLDRRREDAANAERDAEAAAERADQLRSLDASRIQR